MLKTPPVTELIVFLRVSNEFNNPFPTFDNVPNVLVIGFKKISI